MEGVPVKRLRVAVVSDALYPWHKGGKEVRYLRLLGRLPDYDMDVVVYSMKWWDHPPDVVTFPRGTLTYKSICPRVAMYKGTRRTFSQALLFAVSTVRLLTQNFDVIEADHFPYLQLFPLRVVAWIRRKPLVVTWNEVWGSEGWRTYLGRAGWAPALLEKACVHLPDAIIAISTGTAEKLVELGAKANRLHVVPMTVDFEELAEIEPDSSAPELLFIGRLLAHKNANVAIDATSILVSRGFDVRLGVVGVGVEEARLKSQVAALGLDARVTFFAAVETQHELWALLRGSRVLLAPSVREGFGLVVAESLAVGTPVVAALHPENESSKLISPATGSVVAPFDAVALADAAEVWLRHDSARSTRMNEFKVEHSELTHDAMAKSYARILRNATNSVDTEG
jgi:glycosyltransferase involved in cell wall biosynthesis